MCCRRNRSSCFHGVDAIQLRQLKPRTASRDRNDSARSRLDCDRDKEVILSTGDNFDLPVIAFAVFVLIAKCQDRRPDFAAVFR